MTALDESFALTVSLPVISCSTSTSLLFSRVGNPFLTRTNSSACGLGKESLSDRNDLQGGGRASVEEHVVGDCRNSERKCVRGGIVNHWDRGSTWGLTDCRGVLWKRDHLGVETGCRNGAFQHP